GEVIFAGESSSGPVGNARAKGNAVVQVGPPWFQGFPDLAEIRREVSAPHLLAHAYARDLVELRKVRQFPVMAIVDADSLLESVIANGPFRPLGLLGSQGHTHPFHSVGFFRVNEQPAPAATDV